MFVIDEGVVRRRNKQKYSKRLTRSIRFFVLCVLVLIGVIILGISARKKYMDAAYPRHYSNLVEKYAKQNDLPEYLVYSIIKCESGFEPSAVSNIGARGLMQITNDTFDWIQFRMNDPKEQNVVYDDMFDPETNIKYATYLFRHHLDEFGNVEASICAYHAGRGSVNSWLGNSKYSQDGETISEVPFDDTREYLRRVMNTSEIYKDLYYN